MRQTKYLKSRSDERRKIFGLAQVLFGQGLGVTKTTKALKDMGFKVAIATVAGYKKYTDYDEYRETVALRIKANKEAKLAKAESVEVEEKQQDEPILAEVLRELKLTNQHLAELNDKFAKASLDLNIIKNIMD